jgi:hypothetical protein
VLQDPRDPQRLDWRTPRGVRFGSPTQDPLNASTPFLPKLLHERMDDFGLDYTVLYPGLGLALGHEPDEEIRRATVRSLNTYFSRDDAEFRDRMTSVAVPGPQHEEIHSETRRSSCVRRTHCGRCRAFGNSGALISHSLSVRSNRAIQGLLLESLNHSSRSDTSSLSTEPRPRVHRKGARRLIGPAPPFDKLEKVLR